MQITMDRGVYRIIDANFNRAREALRVIEEYCRFTLNSRSFTERTKQLRHELSACLDTLNTELLISSRDTPGDVGIGGKVANQLVRRNLKDCLIAGSKRLTEALRVLSEMTQILNPSTAGTIERLRYSAYTLEKDIAIFSNTFERFKHVRLYVLISSSLPAEVFPLVHRCIAGGADCIQLRAKSANDDVLFAMAQELASICRAAEVLSIINDRVDIAGAAGADGVHLGQNDLPVEQARRLQLKPLIIGKSTHSPDQLCTACSELATYVSLGPVFASPTKPKAEVAGLDYVKQAVGFLAETGIGSVALGGITLDNVGEVLRAGATAVAVCSAITKTADPTAACRAFKRKISEFGK